LQAAGNAAFAAWQARVQTIRVTEPLEWLRQAARLFMQFALDEPARFDACFVIRTGVERRYPRDFRAGKSPVVSMMLERVVAAQAAGLLAPLDPLEITMFFWSQLHGLAMLHRSGRFAMSRGAFLALAARLCEHAIAGFTTTEECA
jgi:hypothetical protein